MCPVSEAIIQSGAELIQAPLFTVTNGRCHDHLALAQLLIMLACQAMDVR